MKIATIENPRRRQEEHGEVLTATPSADLVASKLGPNRSDGGATPSGRCGLLAKSIIEVFCARWARWVAKLGISDTQVEMVHLDSKALPEIGVTLESSTNPAGVIIHQEAKNRLLLIEPVIKTGLVEEKRRKELQDSFAGSEAHLIFVTAFETRRTMQTFASAIARESELWIVKEPDHMIHFNGGRFLAQCPDLTHNK